MNAMTPRRMRKKDEYNVPNRMFQLRHHQKIHVLTIDVFEVAILFATNLDYLQPPLASHDRGSYD